MSERATVLVVEDDREMRRLLEEELGEVGYDVLVAADGAQALERLAGGSVDVVISDLMMPGLKGEDVLRNVRSRDPDLPVVIITAFGSIESAVALVKAGAYHYVAKPFRMDQLLLTVANAASERRLRRELGALRGALRLRTSSIVAESPAMRKVVEIVRQVAETNTPVLLLGESGTGKELIARALHEWSARHERRFTAVNCSAIPDTLLESQLFGHRRGSFTDAREDRLGLFQETQGGTLLLDEIGDMPPLLQMKLLRVLQEREVLPVGASTPVPVDVRVVAATHRDLERRIAEGQFREDLYYRLNVISVRIPSLRERPEDIVPLIAHFLEKHGRRLGRRGHTVSPEALARMHRHPWSGNVRELENVIERALVLGKDAVIDIEDLPEALLPAPTNAGLSPSPLLSLVEVEREHIRHVLEVARGNKAHAARILGLDRKTLYRKVEQYGLEEA